MQQLQREADGRIEAAWTAEWLARQKRLPSLLSLLSGRSRKVTDDERTWAEQIRAREGNRPIPAELTH